MGRLASESRKFKAALILLRPLADFVALARFMAKPSPPVKCRISVRLFQPEKGTEGLVRAVTDWAPDAIVALGRIPDSLLGHWVGVPVFGIGMPRFRGGSHVGGRILRFSVGPTPEQVEAVRVEGSAVHGARIVMLSKRGPVASPGDRRGPERGAGVGARAGTGSPSPPKSGSVRPLVRLVVDNPRQLVAKLLEFRFRPGDLVVLGPNPELFPEDVMRLLVALQFSRGAVVVGFSRRQVRFGAALGVGAGPSSLAQAALRSLSALCMAPDRTKRVRVFEPARTWWYNPRVVEYLKNNHVVLRRSEDWVPVSGRGSRVGGGRRTR